MISRTFSRTPFALGLALAILSMYSMVALAAPQQQGQTKSSGELTVSGNVTVDGAKAISGATLFSDSTITTSEASSAIVRLDGIGRVELLPNSTMKLSFDEAGINGSLDAGRTRVSTNQNIAATIATKDGAATVADKTQASAFTVDVECGNTSVATQAGRVELRASGAETKQIAAGQDATAGTAAPGTRCSRLSTAREADGIGIGGGALAALLIAAGGAIAAAIFATRSDNNDVQINPGGGGNVSPF